MKSKLPTVSVIIVNYNGRHLLRDCLTSLYKLDYPKRNLEVIFVDNNSYDNSVSFVKSKFPKVKLIELEINRGFTGGNVEGLKQATGDYIVLLNSDTRVKRNWLKALVEAAKPRKVGLVSSKLFFDTPFIELNIQSNIVTRSSIDDSMDFSPLGLLMENIICTDEHLTSLVWYESGFYPPQKSDIETRWTKGEAKVLVPFNHNQNTQEYLLTIHGYPTPYAKNNKFRISLGNKVLVNDEISSNQVKQYVINVKQSIAKKNFIWLIQNAGNTILTTGHGKDRGSLLRKKGLVAKEFYEKNNEYLNQKSNLLAVCGAACLIKRKVIENVGFLDDYYFMYYEDLDFSLRAWKQGWDIVYEPRAEVFHKHKGSTGKYSIFFETLIERNHLLFVATHFPFSTFLTGMIKFVLKTLMSLFLTIVFRLNGNVYAYLVWRERTEYRIQAIKFVLNRFINLIYNKKFWMAREKRGYHDFKKYLY